MDCHDTGLIKTGQGVGQALANKTWVGLITKKLGKIVYRGFLGVL